MTLLESITQAILKMEGGDNPKSINAQMIARYGVYNPGHLTWAGQKGAIPVTLGDRRWAGWPTYAEGVEGIRRDVAAKIRRGDTLEHLIGCYAPPNENNTLAYIAFVAKEAGIPTDKPIKEIA